MFEGKDYVYEVYKTRSFSKAADNLYISQPSLSATIKRIETRIGAPLFDRSTTPIQLTDCGQKYMSYIENLMDMEQEFENYLNDVNTLRAGQLSIGGSNLFAAYVLPPLLSRFLAQFPNIDVKLVESSTNDLERQLSAGNLDFVIDNYAFNERIYERHLFCQEQVLLAVPSAFDSNREPQAKQYRLTARDIKAEEAGPADGNAGFISLKLFQNDPFLLLRSGNDTQERSEQLLKDAGISPRIILKLDQQATAYHVASQGMGITFVTDTLVKKVPENPNLCYYRLNPEYAVRNIYFYRKQNHYLTRAMENFLILSCHPSALAAGIHSSI